MKIPIGPPLSVFRRIVRLMGHFLILKAMPPHMFCHFCGSPPSAGIASTDNIWHHFAATFNGTTAYIYVDGQQTNSATPTLNTSDGFRIGYRINGGSYFQGILDEIRVSNTTRTVDWIKLCYQTRKRTKRSLISMTTINGRTPKKSTLIPRQWAWVVTWSNSRCSCASTQPLLAALIMRKARARICGFQKPTARI